MSSNQVILHFPVEFDALYTDKGYWPYAIVELPDGSHNPRALPHHAPLGLGRDR